MLDTMIASKSFKVFRSKQMSLIFVGTIQPHKKNVKTKRKDVGHGSMFMSVCHSVGIERETSDHR